MSKDYTDFGLDLLYINLYDGIEQIEHFENIMEGYRKTSTSSECIGVILKNMV